MFDYSKSFGERIYEWLSTFATTYRGVLPSGITPDSIYILMNGQVSNFSDTFIFPIKIYARNTSSYLSILNIVDKIEKAIGEAGILLIFPEIRVKIHKGDPFYQDLESGSENTLAGYVNLEITVY